MEQHILFLLILSLFPSGGRRHLYITRPPAHLPACLPKASPSLLQKKTEQNECDCIIFVTLCSSNCLYTKKSNKYQKTDYNYVVIFRWV